MADYTLKAYLASLSNDALHALVGRLPADALKDLCDDYKAWAFEPGEQVTCGKQGNHQEAR